jgi:hypothetical protein
MGAGAPSCCLPDHTCGGGFLGECLPWNQPGMPDNNACPRYTTPGGLLLNACCKPNNMCGVISQVGFGCIERTHLPMFAGGPLNAIVCGADTDAGQEDAGK